MPPRPHSGARLKRDNRVDEKRSVFFELNEVAWSRNIAVIYAWVRMTDFLVGVWDDIVFQSNGPLGQPNTCVFCGREGLNSENAYELGTFLADGDCFRDHFVDTQATRFLEANTYRPSVIVITADLPGSIDNLALDLAWGIGAHYWWSQRPGAPSRGLQEAVQSYGRKLANRIAEKRRLRVENWP